MNKMMERELRQDFSAADSDMIKKLICCAYDVSCEMAVAVADKAFDLYGSSIPRSASSLRRLLLDVSIMVSMEQPWLNKFIDWQDLLSVEAIEGTTKEELRQNFITAVQTINTTVTPFISLNDSGTLCRQVQNYVLTHIDEAVTMKSLSVALEVDCYYVSTIFKIKTGMNLGDYLVRMKIQRAKMLLKQRGMKLAVITKMLGFRDGRTFTYMFRRHIGQTPSQYRRSLIWAQSPDSHISA